MKIDQILKQELAEIKPSAKEEQEIKQVTKEIVEVLEKRIKKLKIKAEVYVGGSLAKGTLIKKKKYDIDVFVRFNEKYSEEDIAKLIEKIIKLSNKKLIIKKIHGSRDYYRLYIKSKPIYFEVVPVVKIVKPQNARNVTDLSYFHVNYVKKKINKKKNLADSIRLAKSFLHACNCYGAESYIKGFSGYALELLIIYYGSFTNFIKKIAKNKFKEKLIINLEGKTDVKLMNPSKTYSPIIIVDPTYKERNATAGLSAQTLMKFRNYCIKFLTRPSIKLFEIQEISVDKLKQQAKQKKSELVVFEAKTNKQEGDIAGSKLLKFYEVVRSDIERYFEILASEFDYDEKKAAKFYFIVKPKKEIIWHGPQINDIDNVRAFRKKHKNVFMKNHSVFAREKINITSKKFYNNFKKQNKKKIKQMSITSLNIV